jgi:metal-dependent amidase/aminoacylase/carboxypeptidase family protein
MDANDLVEAAEEKHRPFREGFASVNKGAMHACGHDGHTATGLGVAEVLVGLKDRLAGTVKLIFQPAEEGVRGAKAMVARGVVDDVKYVVGAHLGERRRTARSVPDRRFWHHEGRRGVHRVPAAREAPRKRVATPFSRRQRRRSTFTPYPTQPGASRINVG